MPIFFTLLQFFLSILLQVTPHSAIYFYQFSSPASSNSTWTTRFTITDSASNVVPPPQPTQPGGASIPWGVGTLIGAPTSTSNSTSTSTSSISTSGVSLTSTPSITTSGLSPASTGGTISTHATTSTPKSTSTASASGAVGTVAASTLLWQTIFTLGTSAFVLAVVF